MRRPFFSKPQRPMIPPPMMTTCLESAKSGDAPAEGIVRIQDQSRFSGHKGGPCDRRDDLAGFHCHRALENRAQDSLLPPHLAFVELTIGEHAGEFGAGTRTTGRSVVS